MNNRQIDEILNNIPVTRRFYRGCYASDQLSPSVIQTLTKLNIVIANTIPSSSTAVGHWIAIFVQPNLLSFFDSYGRSPDQFPFAIHSFVKQFSPPLLWNKLAIQGDKSCMCGLYVIFVSVKFAGGHSLSTILSWFSRRDRQLNDRLVYFWCLRNIGASRKLSRQSLFDCAL